MVIANNRAGYYKSEFGGSLERSLAEDTLPLFRSDTYEIKDWAAINMNWSDVEAHAIEVSNDAEEPDYQEGWMNGKKDIIEDEELFIPIDFPARSFR